MLTAAVITTFGNEHFQPYGKAMLESFVANWPTEVPIMVKLDDGTLAPEVHKILRQYDGLQCGMEPEHKAFVDGHKGKDDANNYRKQVVRFCHKVFATKYALDAINKAKAAKEDGVPRHLIWLDADVLTTRKVEIAEIEKCLPQAGDAVSYMGRKKGWDHSECGWLAFDLENGGDKIIEDMYQAYKLDNVLKMEQWHDSWVFDQVLKQYGYKATDLTPEAIGAEVWPQSPMAAWSRHYKGPIAKSELAGVPSQQPQQKGGLQALKIQTKNSIPNDSICQSILENQAQIKNWIAPCTLNDEELVIVAAGPMLIPEDLHEEIKAGRKIVAVKHALVPLKEAGITPWACVLLDPREHLYGFVENPDPNILWFVASQVTPKAVKKLLDSGCTVWGYHASVGAGEAKHTDRQPLAVVDGGSATATRCLSLFDRLGFKKFRLYGYDLCLKDKPDLKEKDEIGQPKYFEAAVGYKLPYYEDTRWFWSKGELLAQADEFRQLMEMKKWEIKAFGNGIVPFLYNIHRLNDLRSKRKVGNMEVSKPVHYEELLACRSKTRLSALWRKALPKALRVRKKAAS